MTVLGHIFSDKGVKPDPAKIKAITEMPTLTSKAELQRFVGMVPYLGKFIPDLSSKTTHLRQLLESTVEWHWSEHQEKAFERLKTEISSSPTLKYYDPQLETMLSVDASKYGLGAVLLQKNETWAPVAYASRSLTKTEQNYAQIEKETLAIVFGTQRFHDYVYGKHFTVESDHKPLQPIFTKPIANAPPRIQRFRLKLQKYDMTIKFTPGKDLAIADALSRAFLPQLLDDELNLESQVHMVLNNLPISDYMLRTFHLDNVGDLTVDGNMGDGGDLSAIDNVDNFAGCNTYVGSDNISVDSGNNLNEKSSDQVCNSSASLRKTSKNLKRCVMQLQKQVKDLKIKNNVLVIIFNYTVCTCVVIHSVLDNVMYEVKI